MDEYPHRRATAVICVAAALMSACATIAGEAPAEVVLVGADLALSGDRSELGLVHRDAMELRVAQVNEQRLLGDRRLQLRVLDNRSDPGTSLTNLTGLASDPQVTAVVTGDCAQCAIEAAGELDHLEMPVISLAAADAVASPAAERRYVFKLGPNAADDAAVLAAELERAGVATVGMVAVDGGYGDDGLREMAAATERARPDLVTHERVLAADRAGVVRAAERIASWRPGSVPGPTRPAGPDAVVVWAPPVLAGQVAASLRGAGYQGGLYLDAVAAGELFLTGSGGEALVGATMVFTETLATDQVIATNPAKAARQRWFRDYTARHGTYHAQASFAADAIGVIVEAVNRAGGRDRSLVRDEIESTRMDGLTGRIRITATNHSGLHPQALTLLVASGDRWRVRLAG
jgi:branched-chain amino acid transport system substrate-binding protein